MPQNDQPTPTRLDIDRVRQLIGNSTSDRAYPGGREHALMSRTLGCIQGYLALNDVDPGHVLLLIRAAMRAEHELRHVGTPEYAAAMADESDRQLEEIDRHDARLRELDEEWPPGGVEDIREALTIDLRRMEREEPTTNAQLCEWFGICANQATQTLDHPTLGKVPACDRCAAISVKL